MGRAGTRGCASVGLAGRERLQGRPCYCSLWAILCTPAQSISWMSAQLFYSFWAVKWNGFSFCSESSRAVALSLLWCAWPVSFSIYICCFSLISYIFLLSFFLLPLTSLCNLFFPAWICFWATANHVSDVVSSVCDPFQESKERNLLSWFQHSRKLHTNSVLPQFLCNNCAFPNLPCWNNNNIM